MASVVNALTVTDLTIRRGVRTVLRGAHFFLAPGERVALTAPSGAGKTTLLRVIAGLDSFDHGAVATATASLTARASPGRHSAWHRQVCLVFQAHNLFPHMTALQNVWLAPVHALGHQRDLAMAQARALLESLGVGHRADALPRALSGGEAQRVAIARALAVRPAVLLLDEPTASLDPSRRVELADTLVRVSEQGTTILASTHDREFAALFATRVLLLSRETVVPDADVGDVIPRPGQGPRRQGDPGEEGSGVT